MKLRVIIAWTLLISGGPTFGQSIDSLIKKAHKDHPLLRSSLLEEEALKYTERVQDSWDAPVFSAGVGILPVETRVGPQIMKLGIQQRIPFSGTQQAKKESVRAIQWGQRARTELSELEVAYQIRLSYHRLSILGKKERLLDSMLTLVQSKKRDRLRRLRSGSGSSSQVVLIERSEREYLERKKQLGYDKQQSTSELAYWVGVDSLPNLQIKENFTSAIDRPLSELYSTFGGNHPQLKQKEAEIRAAEAELLVLKWENYPQLTVGLDYIWNNDRSDVDIPDNGRDALIPMVGIQLPFLSSRYGRKKEEMERKRLAATYRKKNEQQRIQSKLQSALAQLSKFRSEYVFLEKQIKATKRLMNLRAAEIGSDVSGFYDYWLLVEDTLDYQLSQLEAAQKAQEVYFYILKYQNPK